MIDPRVHCSTYKLYIYVCVYIGTVRLIRQYFVVARDIKLRTII